MMGYLFLILALTVGVVKAYCGKRTSSAAVYFYDAIIINTVRMILCVFIGVLFILAGGKTSFAFAASKGLWIALLCGVGTSCFTVSWLLSVRTTAYMLVEVFVMGGAVIPLTLSAVLYKEPVTGGQIVAILLLLAAVYCMCTAKTGAKAKFTRKSVLLLILCAVSSGMSDFSQKLFIRECGNGDVSLFNLYVYLFSAGILMAASFVFGKTEKKEQPSAPYKIVKPVVLYVAVMALCLFLHSYFKTLAAGYLDAVVLYPLIQGCAVVLSLAMSVVLFREKLSPKGLVGVGMAAIAVVLLSIF